MGVAAEVERRSGPNWPLGSRSSPRVTGGEPVSQLKPSKNNGWAAAISGLRGEQRYLGGGSRRQLSGGLQTGKRFGVGRKWGVGPD